MHKLMVCMYMCDVGMYVPCVCLLYYLRAFCMYVVYVMICALVYVLSCMFV